MASTSTSVPAIAAGTKVHLRMAHVGAVPGTVDGTEPGALLVGLVVAEPRLRRLGGSEASVEVISARGIQRFTGTLALMGDRLDVVRVVLGGAIERIQRREFARIDVVTPIRVTGVDEKIGGATETVNISGGGALIRDPWDLPLGLTVRIELEVQAGEPPVRALARVVRKPDESTRGIRIDDIARSDEDRLIRFVREREVAALRVGRGR